MIARLFPLVRPQKIGPGRIDVEEVKPKKGMILVGGSKDLGCNDRTQQEHCQEAYQPFPIRIKSASAMLELRTDKSITFHRSSPCACVWIVTADEIVRVMPRCCCARSCRCSCVIGKTKYSVPLLAIRRFCCPTTRKPTNVSSPASSGRHSRWNGISGSRSRFEFRSVMYSA